MGGVEYAALYDFMNFPASGVVIGVRNNFVFPAQCYSTPRIYIHNTYLLYGAESILRS